MRVIIGAPTRARSRQSFRWLELPEDPRDLHVEHIAHGNMHAGERWRPWLGDVGAGAGRALRRRMARISRHQRDRELRRYGYADLGGEGG